MKHKACEIYDALLIPGGGIQPSGEPTHWGQARLGQAIECFNSSPTSLHHNKRRGFNGPLFRFRVESPAGKFLSECLDEIVRDSIDIEHVIDDMMNKRRAGLLSDATVLGGKSATTSKV